MYNLGFHQSNHLVCNLLAWINWIYHVFPVYFQLNSKLYMPKRLGDQFTNSDVCYGLVLVTQIFQSLGFYAHQGFFLYRFFWEIMRTHLIYHPICNVPPIVQSVQCTLPIYNWGCNLLLLSQTPSASCDPPPQKNPNLLE